MDSRVGAKVAELVNNGWELTTATQTTASLTGRRPFAWWLFILVIFLLPLIGGILYLVFWAATSKATVFLWLEGEELRFAGDEWLMKLQEAQRETYVERQRKIKEQGFLRVMWPQLLASLLLIAFWVYLLKSYA